MATARYTSGCRGQKLNAHYVSALQDKLLTLDKEEDGHTQGHLFVFLFHLFPFHLFTTNATQALPLGTIKGEAGATSRGTQGSKQTPIQEHTSQTNSTNSYATKET
jgi:hypothetical protein